jgi:hypothetical protein
MGQFHKALQDAVKAKDLNPEWAKVGASKVFADFLAFSTFILGLFYIMVKMSGSNPGCPFCTWAFCHRTTKSSIFDQQIHCQNGMSSGLQCLGRHAMALAAFAELVVKILFYFKAFYRD